MIGDSRVVFCMFVFLFKLQHRSNKTPPAPAVLPLLTPDSKESLVSPGGDSLPSGATRGFCKNIKAICRPRRHTHPHHPPLTPPAFSRRAGTCCAGARILRGQVHRRRAVTKGPRRVMDAAAGSCPVIPTGGAQRYAGGRRCPLSPVPLSVHGKALHLPLELCDDW